MSFVPAFFDHLSKHLQQDERRQMLSSLAVSVAPELWVSLESAALLDISRARFGLEERLDTRSNVPRWLIAAERYKVDLWVQDLRAEQHSVSIEFKVVHNNKDAYTKIREARRDMAKHIPRIDCNDSVERWGIVMLVFSRFYDDQTGNYNYHRGFSTREDMLQAFVTALGDDDPWYKNAPRLELAASPVLLAEMASANFIDPSQAASGIYFTLVRRLGSTSP